MINTQFLQNCQAGDESAIESLVRAHQRPVFQIALSVLDDTPSTSGVEPAVLEQAEKATRETFVAALDRLSRYREDMPFESWLYAIAVEVSRRRYRRYRLLRQLGKIVGRGRNTAPVQGNANATVYQAERSSQGDRSSQSERSSHGELSDAALWKAVRVLPENLRLAVVLRYYHEMSVPEIARVLRVSEGAVHARLDAARERIAKEPHPADAASAASAGDNAR
jgi:RNA polymerase sigma-70 factor (ECF subfamily)